MKPVVLAVDDDPAAIHRIGEELRRRYGHDYDVICDQSAPEALGRLEALHDADRAVAVVLADQWMPGLSGTDLLTRVKWSPFVGQRLGAKPERVYVRGRLVARRGQIVDDAVRGVLVRPAR